MDSDNSERRLVQFYAGGSVKGGPKPKNPAKGAPLFKGDGPDRGKKRGGKVKAKKLAVGGPPMDPMSRRMTTGVVPRAQRPRRSLPPAGGAGLPPLAGALGPIR